MRFDSFPKWVRALVAVVALLVVCSYAMGAVSKYRAAGTVSNAGTVQPGTAGAKPPTEAAKSPTDSSKGETSKKKASAETDGPVIVVKVDGLNFRREADKDSDVIRGLDEGERLKLIKEKDGWYKAEDKDGEQGWLYGSDQYSRLEE